MKNEYERRKKMNWISRLERKFGRYAIPNLMYFIIILYGIGFVLDYINPYFYIQYLSLNAAEILHGQIWRIVTFLIQSPSNNLIFLIIALYFYYMIGRTLEQTWGSFLVQPFIFFTGVLFHVIAALLIYLVTGQVYMLGYVLSEPFPVLCFCSGISGHGVPSVLYSACQGKMAGMDRRGIFHLDDYSGFSSVIRRNIHQLPGKCFCGGNFDSEFCDFLCFNEKLRTIFSKAAEAQKRIQKTDESKAAESLFRAA